jgi:hypothetical protein
MNPIIPNFNSLISNLVYVVLADCVKNDQPCYKPTVLSLFMQQPFFIFIILFIILYNFIFNIFMVYVGYYFPDLL